MVGFFPLSKTNNRFLTLNQKSFKYVSFSKPQNLQDGGEDMDGVVICMKEQKSNTEEWELLIYLFFSFPGYLLVIKYNASWNSS